MEVNDVLELKVWIMDEDDARGFVVNDGRLDGLLSNPR